MIFRPVIVGAVDILSLLHNILSPEESVSVPPNTLCNTRVCVTDSCSEWHSYTPESSKSE